MRATYLLMVAVMLPAACSSSPSPSTASRPIPSTNTTAPPVLGPVALASQQAVSPLYSQGVARVPGGWIFSFLNGLYRTDDRIRVLRRLMPAIPAPWAARGFDHIGDIDVVGNIVYAPLEQPNYAKGQQATARYDRDSLRFIDAVLLPQHENSFVTVDPSTMTAYSMDHFDGNALLRYDVAHGWKRLAPLQLSEVLHHTQGADIAHDAVWISTSDPRNDLYRVDLATGQTTLIGSMGHPGGEGEGIDATDLPSGFLHTLCVDPRLAPVWFEHFRKSARH